MPLHFTAFHPDYKMTDVPATPPATLTRARDIALANGLRYVYTGNVHDTRGRHHFCPAAAKPLIVRDWYRILRYELDDGRPLPALRHGDRRALRRRAPALRPAAHPDARGDALSRRSAVQ